MADPEQSSARSAVPDAVAPPPGNRRFPLIDGMRAIAVVAVVVHHVFIFSGLQPVGFSRLLAHLNIGVTIFFVISGFVLYRPFIGHRNRGPVAPPVGQYAKRRFLRIFPAYWLALTVLTILPGTTGVVGGQWLSQYALLHTLPFTDGPTCIGAILTCGLAQTWSLVVELTFYAVLPIYALTAERLVRGRAKRTWVSLELGLLGALALASVVVDFGTTPGQASAYVGGTVLGHVLWFALGMALAVASVAVEGVTPPQAVRTVLRFPAIPWLLAAGLFALLTADLPPTPFLLAKGDQAEAYVGFAFVAFLLVLPAVFGDDAGGLPRRFLSFPLVKWLGLISYGIFLWHYAVVLRLGSQGSGLGFAPLLISTLAISIAAAAASYYLLERRVLRFKHRTLRRTPRPGTRQRPL